VSRPFSFATRVRSGGQEHDCADVGDQKLESAFGRARIERRRGGAKALGCGQQIAKGLSHLDSPWGELHRMAISNDQWVAEMRPQPGQCLAYAGLRRLK